MRLYHWTCSHGFAGIGKRGLIRPHAIGVVWLTDDPTATRQDLGLTSQIRPCDRMTFLYAVETIAAVPWLESDARARAPADRVADLESFGKPSAWWVASKPVRGVLLRKKGKGKRRTRLRRPARLP